MTSRKFAMAASLQAQIDAVKAAVASTSTCTAGTVATLKKLLQVDSEATPWASTTKARSRKHATTAKRAPYDEPVLNSRERNVLAIFVAHTTRNALAEAIKVSTQTKPLQRARTPPPTDSRLAIRLSASAPLSPLKPQALNRAVSSPSVKDAKSDAPKRSIDYLPMIECSQVAFACLRSLQRPPKNDESDFEVEKAMTVLIASMITLNLHDEALKELKLMRKRLDAAAPMANSKAPPPDSPAGIAGLLQFPDSVQNRMVPVITALQMQVLRLVAVTKNAAPIESMLPVLKYSNPCSPMNLFLWIAQADGKSAKVANQLAQISRILLVMASNNPTSQDALVLEPCPSLDPTVVFELQVLALETNLTRWKLVDEPKNLDNAVLSPFDRFARAFYRRRRLDDKKAYQRMTTAFKAIMKLARSQDLEPTTTSDSPLLSIYHAFGLAAHAANQYEQGYSWFRQLKDFLGDEAEAQIRVCSASAGLLAALLKRRELDANIKQHVRDVTESLRRSFVSTFVQRQELLKSLLFATKSVAHVLETVLGPDATNKTMDPEVTHLLKKFILDLPWFLCRRLGNCPEKDGNATQVAQYDEQKQLVLSSMDVVLSAVATVTKWEIPSGVDQWRPIDKALQQFLALVQSVVDAKTKQFSSCYIHISNLYYYQFSKLFKLPQRSKQVDKLVCDALSRSIDTVKERSLADKERAGVPAKLELFADVCRRQGRSGDALKALASMCTELATDGALLDVAAALATKPLVLAWASHNRASLLSRMLGCMAKLDASYTDWTRCRPEAERAAVLEHLMELVSPSSPCATMSPRLYGENLTTMLKIYTLKSHPVRRVRVLLRAYDTYRHMGQSDGLEDISQELSQALQQLERKDLAQDSGLCAFIPHLKAYHDSTTALTEAVGVQMPARLAESVASWKTMIKNCKTKTDLFAMIHDAKGLLHLLKQIKDRAGLAGDYILQLSASELSITLCEILSDDSLYRHDLVLNHSQLAAQYVGMGRYAQALKSLEQAKTLIEHHQEISDAILAEFHLSHAEYHVGTWSFDEATTSINKIKGICSRQLRSARAGSIEQTEAMASMLQSTVSLHRGDTQEALQAIGTSIHIFYSNWDTIEMALSQRRADGDRTAGDTSTTLDTSRERISSPWFWHLAPRLLRSVLQLSAVYAHVGLLQETLFFAKQAEKKAERVNSSLYKAAVSAWIGHVFVKAGKMDQASPYFDVARDLMPRDGYLVRVRFALDAGEFYRQKGDEKKALEHLEMAEDAIEQLSSYNQAAAIGESSEVSRAKATASKMRTAATTRSQRTAPAPCSSAAATRSRRLASAPFSAAARAAPNTKAKATKTEAKATKTEATATRTEAAATRTQATATRTEVSTSRRMAPNGMHESSLRLAILLTRALGFVERKKWSAALSLLEEARQMPRHLGIHQVTEVLMTATSLIGRSMEQMISDPVFSVMQDSTISLPAVCGQDVDALSCAKGNGKRQRERNCPAFMKALRQAQEMLVEAHGSALSMSESSMIHRISALLQSTGIFLSATSASKFGPGTPSSLASVAVDVGRNVTWMREFSIIKSQPVFGHDSMDMEYFTHSYVDLIPKNWSVISISLDDNRQDLCINKLQSGHSPFILRLPLERAHSRDVDSEIFNFQHGYQELLEIVELANKTSRMARNITTREDLKAWHAKRWALDLRLKTLLDKVDATWLGGFRGIFSQSQQHPDLLERFYTAFHKMLGETLPSRQPVRGKRAVAKASPITLDPRILQLFVSLGDFQHADSDYQEALTDLLYFVVDILQLHGERNAYDEIPFDEMVIKTRDALRSYFDAATSQQRAQGAHTILVLGKVLHAFPWESLPCMQGLAVSRVPSLECLRKLLTEARMPATVHEARQGHYVSAKSGTYMLNPSSDLKTTETYFQPALARLDGWNNITSRAPEESEFEKTLASSNVLLYFGHGDGSQYIKAKKLRRLDRCRPAIFLMGCGSAALVEAGDFECHGTVWSYMMAGCPAVVGSLWDVTDRDIDRFAGCAFEKWGLFPHGTFGRATNNHARHLSQQDQDQQGQNPQGDDPQGDDQQDQEPGSSLVEAVATARAACHLRYLTGAAIVVYGIPVYIDPTLQDEQQDDDET